MKTLPLLGSIVALVGAVLCLQFYNAATSPVIFLVYATIEPETPERVLIQTGTDTKIDVTDAHHDNLYFSTGAMLFAVGCFTALASVFLSKKSFTGVEKMLVAISGLGIALFGILNWGPTTQMIKGFSTMAASAGADPSRLGYTFTEGIPAMHGAAILAVVAAVALVLTSVIMMRVSSTNSKISAAKKVGIVFLGLFLIGILLSQLGRGNSALESITTNIKSNGFDPIHVAGLISRYFILSTASYALFIISGILAFCMAIASRSIPSQKS